MCAKAEETSCTLKKDLLENVSFIWFAVTERGLFTFQIYAGLSD